MPPYELNQAPYQLVVLPDVSAVYVTPAQHHEIRQVFVLLSQLFLQYFCLLKRFSSGSLNSFRSSTFQVNCLTLAVLQLLLEFRQLDLKLPSLRALSSLLILL